MTVNTAYNIMRFIARKNQLGSLSPSDFQYAFNTAQRNYYDLLVGRIEQYRYDKPTPRIGLSMTDNVVTRLMPFEKTATIAISSNLTTKPTDFNKLLSMTTPDFRLIYRVEENRFSSRYYDLIDPIDSENGFYVEQTSNWRVYAPPATSVLVKYLSLPTDVAWGYYLDGSGRPVYSTYGTNIATTGSGTNWTGTSFATGYTHTTGQGYSLATTIIPNIGTYYTGTLTITGRTAGSITLLFGGQSFGGITGSASITATAIDDTSLTITPTSDFNGTITLSLKAPSVDPLWLDNDMDEVIARALKILGVSIKESALLTYGEQVIQKGE